MSNLRIKTGEFVALTVNFGLAVAFYSVFFKFCHNRYETHRITDYINKKKDESILRYLRKNYGYLLNQSEKQSQSVSDESYIWICWWQGEEKMPQIVRRCYQSVCKHSGSRKVILITEANVGNYIKFPDYIMARFREGLFDVTHISDILRMNLLAEYGGLWIDATVFVTLDISPVNSYFTVRHEQYGHHPSQRKWTQFLIGGAAGDPLFCSVSHIFRAYWQKETVLINYFLNDYLIRLVYEGNDDIRERIDQFPVSNPELYYMLEYFNSPYDKAKFDEISACTTFHKLKWKEPLSEYTTNGELTYYGYIIHSNDNA